MLVMAEVSAYGRVTCKQGEQAFSLREGEKYAFLTFSLLDAKPTKSFFKNPEDNPGQFFQVEVTGKKYCSYLAEHIKQGRIVNVTGQAVWSRYNDKKYLTVKNSQVTFLDWHLLKDDTEDENSDPF